MPVSLFALAAGAFGIGVTEFVIMGLLQQVGADLHASISEAGLLISGYALAVAVGAPVLTLATRRLPRKQVLLAMMAIFTLGNLACALAPGYGWLMAARMLTALAHGTFFGVGAVVASRLVAPQRRASAVALMFTGLTLATLLGVPAGAWIGLHFGWRATFAAVTAVGVFAWLTVAALVPRVPQEGALPPWRSELAVLQRPGVWRGLAMTALGFGGVFAVVTYLEPLLTRVTGLADAAVSPVLLVFGGGFAVGNLLGGRLADRGAQAAVQSTLIALALTLAAMPWALGSVPLAMLFVGLLGAAAFATATPMQMRVMEQAAGTGQNLASSLNIAAFNVGNALGAWAGGVTVDHGPGLRALGWVGALLTLGGLALAYWNGRVERMRPARA